MSGKMKSQQQSGSAAEPEKRAALALTEFVAVAAKIIEVAEPVYHGDSDIPDAFAIDADAYEELAGAWAKLIEAGGKLP